MKKIIINDFQVILIENEIPIAVSARAYTNVLVNRERKELKFAINYILDWNGVSYYRGAQINLDIRLSKRQWVTLDNILHEIG